MASVPAKTSPGKGKKASDSDDSSDESNSEKSSSDEEMDDKTSAPAQIAPIETYKKRKADSEAVAGPKKVKLADGGAGSVSSEETLGIFVGQLSWNVDNDWLAQEFAECGQVESARVQMDRNTGRSRGFGYVNFKTVDAVEKALALNGKEIDGRAVRIDKSNPPDKKTSMDNRAQAFGDVTSPPSAVLFVGNLSFGVNEDTLWETFGDHGDIKSIRVPTDRDSGKPKGFAYVEFSDVGSAKKAHGSLQGVQLDGRSIRLDYSQPRDSAGGRGGGQGGRGGRGQVRGRGGFGGDRGGFGGGGFGGDRGRGGGRGFRGGRGGERGGRGGGRNPRTGGITQFEGQKITF
ncbi:hypothetical protein EV363DRAFT_1404656 [Boletus edulis]|nr:hypothetical protein EV363DRAFT_1404656 [Boletus edulis]